MLHAQQLEHRVAVGLDVLVRLGVLVHRIVVELVAMHPRRVRRVDAALHRLQPSRRLEALADVAMARRQQAPLELGRRRLLLRRPQVRPQDVAALDAWIRLELHLAGEARHRGQLDALPGDVVLPAVVRAADAALLVAPEEKRCAAMRAEFADQPRASLRVAKSEQALAENLHAHRRAIGLGDFRQQHHRHPVAPHQVAHRRSGARAHQQLCGFLVHAR